PQYAFFDDPPTSDIYTLSLHDALPISNSLLKAAPPIGPSSMILSADAMREGLPIPSRSHGRSKPGMRRFETENPVSPAFGFAPRSEEHTSELQSQSNLVCRLLLEKKKT